MTTTVVWGGSRAPCGVRGHGGGRGVSAVLGCERGGGMLACVRATRRVRSAVASFREDAGLEFSQ